MATIKIIRQPLVDVQGVVSSINPMAPASQHPQVKPAVQAAPQDGSARMRPAGDLFAGAAPIPQVAPVEDNGEVGAGMALSGALGTVEAVPEGVASVAPAPVQPAPVQPAPAPAPAPKPRATRKTTAVIPQKAQEAPAAQPAVNKEQDVPWEGKNVVLCLPWYKFTNPMTAIAIAAFTGRIGLNRCGMVWAFGDAMIQNARNTCAEKFLQTGAEWSFWVDDDVIPTFGAAYHYKKECGLSDDPKDPYYWPDELASVHAVDRLVSHNQPVVGGVYFGRRRVAAPMFGAGMTDRNAYDAAKSHADALVETDWVATGLLLVNRKIFTEMQEKFPELAPQPNRPQWDFFRKADDGGEDVGFCNRVRAMGYPVYADTGCQALHLGNMAYGFHNTISVPKTAAQSKSGLF